MFTPDKFPGENAHATCDYLCYRFRVYPYDLLPFIRYLFVRKVLRVDDSEVTPSHTFEDGKDYVPTKKWVNFGSHFAAIAAAGPLVGPVLAAQYGYLPGFLWLLIGCVIGGAVHDTVVLFASMKHQGKSLSEVAKSELGPVAGWCTGLAMLFIITITMAGLSMVVVHALERNPWGDFRSVHDHPYRHLCWLVGTHDWQHERGFVCGYCRYHGVRICRPVY